ncbi:hypothetical protein L207DRAFT_590466 [Hyaloscypha variabilis F]|uniref:Carbohydrate kinase PfkB domain-containing protein n=1 Tax=Hyaloscypha variabilis (strain UAMH 11265 / GT02V1 / F) TaxID=1149755 RepID=A0A2J6R2N4_HYAVF|nr:hypothetical protein L207DRAFT_590466 [Hyaloscypha variabilis F]
MMIGPASWQAPFRLVSRPNPVRHILIFSRSVSHQEPNNTYRGWRRPKGLFTHKPTLKPSSLTEHLVFQISPEVSNAVKNNLPVVALETTIYTHGFPYPENVALALDLEKIVRANGAIPATIGVVEGVARVGLTNEEITTLAAGAGNPDTMKVSRRDLPYILGMGVAGRKLNGGTTVSGTMLLASKAGIRVFGTGGLGGVHRGGQDTMDISADLTELGRTHVAVISSGCKSFLDIPRTLEYLETQGVTVCTFADGRTGPIDFPAFYTRDSGSKSPMVVQDAREAAAIIYSQTMFKEAKQFGMLFANPIPEEFALQKAEIDAAIDQAVQEAAEQGFHGHANTPFILSRIKDLTHGNSLPANRALIESNVAMAAKVAVELSKYDGPTSDDSFPRSQQRFLETLRKDFEFDRKKLDKMLATMNSPKAPGNTENLVSAVQDKATQPHLGKEAAQNPDIVVYGSVAMDLSCDYAPPSEGAASSSNDTAVSPQMHTSNLAAISPSVGGVGRNVALAAHRAGGNISVLLRSLVANDIAGQMILTALEREGLYTGSIRSLPLQQSHRQNRTAQYVAVNDAKKDLVLAMADMSIFSAPNPPKLNMSDVSAKWGVVDANWHPQRLRKIIIKLKLSNVKVAYEPVSVPKSGGVFQPSMDVPKVGANAEQPHVPNSLGLFPAHTIDLATPNQHELAAMHAAAKKWEFFDSQRWWQIIDSLGIPSSGARDRFVSITTHKMTDEGIPFQTIQLLPFIPTILTKLGADGVLLTEILKPDDLRLTDPAHAPYILSRTSNGSTEIGGVYMRLFPPVEVVEDVVSVNGVGDTFLGVLLAGLAKGLELNEDLVNIAQRGAVMTLRSKEAVSPQLGELTQEFHRLQRKEITEGATASHEI